MTNTPPWPQPVAWPSPDFLQQLRTQAYDATVEILAHPNPEELDINEQSLRGYQLAELVVEFSGLAIRLDAGRRSHYYRVRHNIVPPPASGRNTPLFWYEVEYSPEGEFWDEFFVPF